MNAKESTSIPSSDEYEKKDSAVASYLLKGWTMTAESCQRCNYPLMRSTGGNTICAACRTEFDSTSSTSQRGDFSRSSDDCLNEKNEVIPEGKDDAVSSQVSTRDQTSRKMGEYLLKGYKMLNVVCSACNTPLFSSRENVEFCVSCSEDSRSNKQNNQHFLLMETPRSVTDGATEGACAVGKRKVLCDSSEASTNGESSSLMKSEIQPCAEQMQSAESRSRSPVNRKMIRERTLDTLYNELDRIQLQISSPHLSDNAYLMKAVADVVTAIKSVESLSN